jgi:hypothetical protein
VTTARRLWPFIAIAAVVILAVHAGVFVRDGLAADRLLQDTDGYMWLNRVIHLHETGAWFDHTYPRLNPPDGHVQHWTRPFDALLLAGGLAVGAAVGFERGLYYWAIAITPLMHLLALAALLWGVRPLIQREVLPRAGLPTLLLVFVAQVGAYQPFLMGRPDHHAPMALLFVLYLGLLLHMLLDRRHDTRTAVALGLVSALALWILVEALVFIALGMLALGLSWMLGNDRIARPNAIHAAALFGGVVLALLLEWGPAAGRVREVDTLSLVHVTLFGLTALFWALLLWASDARSIRRPAEPAGIAALGAGGVLGGTALLFPDFLGSPFGRVDPLLAETWLFRIVELQPLLGPGLTNQGVGMLVLFGGATLLTLPYAIARVLRPGDREERIVWLLFAIAMALFLGLSLHQRRWTDYLALSTVLPFGVLAVDLLGRVGRRVSDAWVPVARPLSLLGLVFGPILLAAALGVAPIRASAPSVTPAGWGDTATDAAVAVPVPARNPARRTCDLARIAEVLNDPGAFPGRQLVLAHTDHGPELLYRTRHDVLSITNHRHQPGYTFMWEVLAHPDHDAAAAALRARGVGAIVLCRSDLSSGFFELGRMEAAFLPYLASGGVPQGYVLHAATPYWRVYRLQRIRVTSRGG